MPLQSPPRDAEGKVTPHDHAGILATDGIIRRVSPEYHVVEDPKTGGRRISSILFRPSSDGGMSVDLEREINEAGFAAREYVTNPKYTGSVRFEAGPLRENRFVVGFAPLPENPYHGEVWFRKSKANEKILRSLCAWFVEIEGVSIGA